MERIRAQFFLIFAASLGTGGCLTFKASPPTAPTPDEIGNKYRGLYAVTHQDMSRPKPDSPSGANPPAPAPAPVTPPAASPPTVTSPPPGTSAPPATSRPADTSPPIATPPVPAPVTASADSRTLTPSLYARAGYTLALEHCNDFFDAVTRASNDVQMTKADVAAIGTAAAAIIALVHRASKPVGITAAAFGLGAVGFDNYQKYALLTAYPAQTRDLVLSAMKAYRENSPPSDATDIIEADARVSGYAQLCTYSSINALAGQAIGSSTAKAVGGNPTPPPTSVFTSADELAKVADIQKQLGLSSIPSDDTLAALALMADANTSTTDLPRIAAKLPEDVKSKVWDGTKKLTLLNNIAATLTALSSNPAFKQKIADTKAGLRPGDRNPQLVAPAAPVAPKEWQPPTILINGGK